MYCANDPVVLRRVQAKMRGPRVLALIDTGLSRVSSVVRKAPLWLRIDEKGTFLSRLDTIPKHLLTLVGRMS